MRSLFLLLASVSVAVGQYQPFTDPAFVAQQYVAAAGGLTAPSYVRNATNAWGSGALSRTITNFNCSGGDFLVVGLNAYGSGISCTQVLANAIAMTKLVATNWYGPTAAQLSLWGLAAPTTGDVAASFSISSSEGGMCAVLFLNGSAAGKTTGQYGGSGLYGMTNTVTDTLITDGVVDALGWYATSATRNPGPSQTKVSEAHAGGNYTSVSLSLKTGTSESTTMSWTNSSSDNLSHIMAVIHGK